jgi:hypothetical protein
MTHHFHPLLILLIATALTGTAQTPPAGGLHQALVGEWYNVYVRITITDSGHPASVMSADSSNWEARLHIKPIHTRFNPDGSYSSIYHDLRDSILMKKTGIWAIEGDTLIMTQLAPDKEVTRLQLSITGNRATFSGLIDFNGDGKKDDQYYGIQRKS